MFSPATEPAAYALLSARAAGNGFQIGCNESAAAQILDQAS
jgi:hypothetical protein